MSETEDDEPHDDENTPASAEEEAYQRRLWLIDQTDVDPLPDAEEWLRDRADDLKKRDRGE